MAIITLAEAGSVTTSGLDGTAVTIGHTGSQVGGPTGVAKGTVYFNITKTAGGTINPATETLKIMLRAPGSATWCDVCQSHEDADPVNFFDGVSGASAINRAFPVTLGSTMKIVIDGDGVDDTYDIDEDIVLEVI